MRKVLGPERTNWGTRVVKVGNIDTRRLSISRIAEIAIFADDDDSVDVEYEFSNSRECTSADECNKEEESTSVNQGLDVLATVETAVSSGTLTQTIKEEASITGLNELANVVVEEVVTEAPEIEVIEVTAYPTISKTLAPTISVVSSPPSLAPTFSCSDSQMRFKLKYNGEKITMNLSI